MDYVALDVETANENYASICQVGIAHFKSGEVVDRFCELVNPEDEFSGFNTQIHGISSLDVRHAKKFPDIYNQILRKLDGQIVVHHMPFDRVAVAQACEKYGLDPCAIKWLDSARIARRTWEEFKERGYGLANVAEKLGIQFRHHDALEDAIAAGLIVQKAIEKIGINLEDWVLKVDRPLSTAHSYPAKKIHYDANPDGPLYGETIVFTGALSIPRKEASSLAAEAGCSVASNVTKKVTIVVVGVQDEAKVGESGKSSKQLEAERLVQDGAHIEIIDENVFKKIVEKGGCYGV